ncbi:Putative Ig domain-containing protein [Collimonas sp. OK607]|uniref:putative Ig domain-containing protein n=1 Tax=Collimonas sp. OK607 TaxID=1798194 RepID=UPI0008F20FB6|nr:putative Ig domain-containing protein [Collimonas sp. OK607]SFA99020.1 Putative Ig domain-containing protein [Collimonas sp. OK607]
MLLRPHGWGGTSAMSASASGASGEIIRKRGRLIGGAAWFARLLAGLSYAAIFGWASQAYAAGGPSTECPPTQTMTVASGGTATADLSGCSLTGLGGMSVAPTHGSVPDVSPSTGNATSLVTYVNNGDGALSDTFTVLDDVNNTIVFTVTVLPASSPITVTPASLPNPSIGSTYSQTLSATGGVAPYVYSLASGSLPAGLILSSTGAITGTPTAAGSFTFTVGVHDSTSPTALATTKTYSVIIAAPVMALSPGSPPAGTVSQSYSQQLSTSGGTAPYAYAVQVGLGNLPPGLSMSSGGLISGTPTAAGSSTFSVKYTDSSTGTGPFSQAKSMTIVINATPVVVAPATLTAGAVGVAYAGGPLTASGGTAPYTFSITAGALPAGMSLSSSGALTGTPTAGGTFSFTVRATDQNSFSGSLAYTLVINAPTIGIAPTTLPAAAVASAYSQNVTASGGTGGYTYAITAGALPAGTSLSSAGVLSGTPTAGGTFNFTVTATDSSTGTGPYTGSRAYALTVNAPFIALSPATLAAMTVGSSVNQNVTASGGTSSYVYSIIAGALPPGLSLASNGTLAGTPTVAGPFNFTVSAADSSTGTGPYTGSRAYSVSVATGLPVAGPVSATVAYGSSANPITLNLNGGVPTSVAVASAAAHGTAAASGTSITYTPAAGYAGADSFTYTATNGAGTSSPATVSVTVSTPTLTLTPAGPILTPVYGNAFSQSFSTSGGVAPYTYALSGSLPTGLSWNAATATLSGTPTQSGNFPVTVTATDQSTGAGAPFSIAIGYTLAISAPIISLTSATLPGSAIGTSYTASISASGGIGPYTYAVSAGALPTGVSLNGSSGALSGTPTEAGAFGFTVRASDVNSFAGTRTYNILVGVPTLTLTPASLPAAAVAVGYSATFTAGGGTSPYNYTLTGTLPSGITFNSATGVLSGTTAQAGSFPITVRATDSSTGAGAPFTVQNSYTLTVAAPSISLAPSSIAGGTVAVSYSAAISASGGAAPYAYSLVSGALPAGVTLNASTGALSGTPSAAGTFSFTVRGLDANNFSGSQAYSLAIAAATVTLNPATLPNPTAEAAYTTTLTAVGGTAPYSFAVAGGALPSGLTLNSATGVLSGTANQSGSFTFNIRASDSSSGAGAPFSATVSYTLNVGAPTIAVTPGVMAAAKVNVAYSQQFTAGGGIAPYTYAIAVGSLPAGLTLNTATGLLSGTPSAAGSFGFTVRATDTQNFSGQQALTLGVGQAQPVAVNDSAATTANQLVTVNVTANDSGPITSIAISTPPAHGSVAVSGLNAVYTPASNYFGNDSFSYTATGPGGTSTPASVTVAVTPLAVPVAVPQTATVLAGQPVTLHAANGASGGPFTLAVVVSAPSAGTTAVSGTDIVYTSAVGSSGDIRFSYTLANAFGASAPVTAIISVNPMPVAGAHNATVSAGATVNVDLMAGASGGPFTAASMVAVSPAAAGSAVIRDVGTAGKPAYQMSFTAASTFAGQAAVSYTLSNAFATSAPGSVNVTVTPRRDMSTDPEVTGLLAAQADSTRRFATAQISNFTRRLESLHGDGWGSSGFGLSFAPPATNRPGSNAGQWQNSDVDRMLGSPLQPNMRKVGWPLQSAAAQTAGAASGSTGNGNGPVLAASDTQLTVAGLPELPVRQDNPKQPLSLWMGGAVDFGQQNVNGRQAGFRFTTNGVSAGGDYRINDLATIGLGAGFSRDSSDVGDNGTKSTAESVVAAMYGSLRPAKNVFVDAVLGYGTLNFNATRYVTDGGGFATGLRHGDQVFGAIVSGIEFRQQDWMWSPYGRVELMSATLDQYTETASGLNALTYFKQTVRTSSGSLGVRAEGQYVTRFGTWGPRARLEFRHQFQGQDDAKLAYADLAAAGPAYIVHTTSQDTGNWSAGLGARLVMHNGTMFTIDYSSNLNVGNGRSQSIMFGLEVPLN